MEESLDEMQVDHVDAYYFMGANNVSIMKSDEMLPPSTRQERQGQLSWRIDPSERRKRSKGSYRDERF